MLAFFTTSTRTCSPPRRGGRAAPRGTVGRRHRAAAESGYFRAKVAQEKLIAESGQPYSIVHATQFFEFVGGIADEATVGDTARLAPGTIQPIAAEDVAAASDVPLVAPPLGTVEIGGPEALSASTS